VKASWFEIPPFTTVADVDLVVLLLTWYVTEMFAERALHKQEVFAAIRNDDISSCFV